MFYLHPWEIDPEQPRLGASAVSRFRHYYNIALTEARLRRLLKDFRFGTVSAALHGPSFDQHALSASPTMQSLRHVLGV
jgi:hypothetical protein